MRHLPNRQRVSLDSRTLEGSTAARQATRAAVDAAGAGCHSGLVAKGREPQRAFAFARPKPKRGGLELDRYVERIEQLRADARRIAEHFELPDFELDADRPDARSRYGQCDSEGGIRVRLVNVRTGRDLKYSALIDTVVHELAHLRHFDHGPRWEALYRRMLEWSRAQGIYQPRPVAPPSEPSPAPPVRPPEPPQLELFAPPGRQRG